MNCVHTKLIAKVGAAHIIAADTGKNYNPHIRPWYINPVKARNQSWGEIYPHISGKILYLGAGQPVYNNNGKLQGVLLSNINLLKIGNFLRSLKVGKTGQSFIIERSGKLVATSTIDNLLVMAREIHDTLAQAFTGIAIHLGGALRVVENAEAVKEHITIARELSRTGLAEARASVQALRSPFLTNNDLCSALNQVATQVSLASDAEIIYQVKGTPYALPSEIESNLLRIGQEALSNATKHTNASLILMELIYSKRECVLRVKDNGQGFITDNVTSNSSFGILGMRERCNNIGAEFTINSQLGQGTEILVSLNCITTME